MARSQQTVRGISSNIGKTPIFETVLYAKKPQSVNYKGLKETPRAASVLVLRTGFFRFAAGRVAQDRSGQGIGSLLRPFARR
jgi:hypothetical protein